MIENVVEFFKNLPPKQCVTCGEKIEEQHECYGSQCDSCNELQVEKRKRPCRFDGHKTLWRSGVVSAAQPEWLMTRESGRWSLDTEKRKEKGKRRMSACLFLY